MSNLIAHRGVNNKNYKENTKLAIRDSLLKDYVKGIEFDVRMTKDGKIVVIHDSTINRTSDGFGFVKNMTYKNLRKYNFGTKENPCKISTLKEIIKICPKDKIILIEIKQDKESTLFVERFYKEISKYLFKNIYIMSFNEDIINQIKNAYPNLKCGILISKIINSSHLNDNYDFLALSSYSIDKLKDYKKPIFVWALNNKKKYLELKKNMSDNTFYIVDMPIKYI